MSKTHRYLTTAAVVAGAALVASAPARAADTAPPALHLITLTAANGPANIGAEVGFNPQPDPPGAPATVLDLRDPTQPTFINGYTGGGFSLVFAFQGLGTGVIPLPDAPNSDGRTGFEQTIDGHILDVSFAFTGGGGPVDPASWVSFNPQPDPPGDVIGAEFQFEGRIDPDFSFTATLDGAPLSFTAAPEPATWAMMMVGFGGVGALLRRRAVRPALL